MLKIHHFRNATMVIETEKEVILVDPMLGSKGTLPTFTLFRFKAQKNPIVSLPKVCTEILSRVTHCIITHKHPDHIDPAGEKFLTENNIPVTCSINDQKFFKKKGFNVVQGLKYWNKSSFLGGTIEGIPAEHGYGFAAKVGGNVMGFVISLPNQKSIYLSSDTVYTDAVDKVLKTYKPDISVVACGKAQLDIFNPLLMTLEDIVLFAKNAPGKVIANHLEALNHCPTTRASVRKAMQENGLSEKVLIPVDGEVMEMDSVMVG